MSVRRGKAAGCALCLSVHPVLDRAINYGFYTRDPSTERPVSVPDQISIINIKTNKLEASRPITANLFGITSEGKYLIAGDGPRLHFIDTKTYRIAKTLQFDTSPGGVAVSRSKDKTGLLCYVWLPDENRLFFAGLTGVLPISPA